MPGIPNDPLGEYAETIRRTAEKVAQARAAASPSACHFQASSAYGSSVPHQRPLDRFEIRPGGGVQAEGRDRHHAIHRQGVDI